MSNSFVKQGAVVATPSLMTITAVPAEAETPAEQANPNGGELSRYIQDASANGGGVEITPEGGVKRLDGD